MLGYKVDWKIALIPGLTVSPGCPEIGTVKWVIVQVTLWKSFGALMTVHEVTSVYRNCRDETEPETIEDMSAEKPEGWLDDEPELVADETAEKPSDWSVHSYAVYNMLYFCKVHCGYTVEC